MAIDRAVARPQSYPSQNTSGSSAADGTQAVKGTAGSASTDAAALPLDNAGALRSTSRPELPAVREDLLDGLSPQEAYAALASKLQDNRTRSAEDTIARAEKLRVANAPARAEVVSKASDNFLERIWNGLVKTVTSNPTAAIGLVFTAVSSIAGVIASGGAGIPAAIAAISAAAAPIVTATLAEAGINLDQLLARGVEELLKLAGVDEMSAWKASQVVSSVINLGVGIGVAVVSGNPAAFDTNLVGKLMQSVGAAIDMKRSSIDTIANTIKGFAALGMLIGGSVASGAKVLEYGGLDKILANGEGAFRKILDSFSQGLDLGKLGEAGSDLAALIPQFQKWFEQAFTDLQANGDLLNGLSQSWQAIVDYVNESSALAEDSLSLRRNYG